MSPVTTEIHIEPLANVPKFFAQVAAWHHQECERQGLKSTLELRQQRLQLHMQGDPIPQTLIALDQQALIGCVSLVNYNFRTDNSVLIPRNTSYVSSPIWLSNLFVREDIREQGIGTQLIDAAINYTRALGMNELCLSAAEFTEFYQRRGWKIVRRTRLGGRQVNVMKREWV